MHFPIATPATVLRASRLAGSLDRSVEKTLESTKYLSPFMGFVAGHALGRVDGSAEIVGQLFHSS